jgi:hypothetical protein
MYAGPGAACRASTRRSAAIPSRTPISRRTAGKTRLDDRAVLRREPPRRQEAPAGEGQHHPGEQGKGEE